MATIGDVPADTPMQRRNPLSRLQFASILALSVALFLFAGGSLWSRRWDLARIDEKILWTYAIIPVLVLMVLVWKRNLTFMGFFLPTLELVLLKFAVTYLITSTLWMLSPPAPKTLDRSGSIAAGSAEPSDPDEPTDPARPRVPSPEPTRLPTAISPRDRVHLSGVVRDDQGRVIPYALVYVASGLESMAFEPPGLPLDLEQRHALIAKDTPAEHAPTAVMAGQSLRFSNQDARLHTVVSHDPAGNQLFNVPLPAAENDGKPRKMTLPMTPGWIELGCRVHPAEPPFLLLVLEHPFFTHADAQGRYTLDGVPKQAGRIEAIAPRAALTGSTVGSPGAVVRAGLRVLVLAPERREQAPAAQP